MVSVGKDDLMIGETPEYHHTDEDNVGLSKANVGETMSKKALRRQISRRRSV